MFSSCYFNASYSIHHRRLGTLPLLWASVSFQNFNFRVSFFYLYFSFCCCLNSLEYNCLANQIFFSSFSILCVKHFVKHLPFSICNLSFVTRNAFCRINKKWVWCIVVSKWRSNHFLIEWWVIYAQPASKCVMLYI